MNATAIVIIAATVVVIVAIVVLRLLTVLRTAVVFWALWLFLLWLTGLGSGWLIGTLAMLRRRLASSEVTEDI